MAGGTEDNVSDHPREVEVKICTAPMAPLDEQRIREIVREEVARAGRVMAKTKRFGNR